VIRPIESRADALSRAGRVLGLDSDVAMIPLALCSNSRGHFDRNIDETHLGANGCQRKQGGYIHCPQRISTIGVLLTDRRHDRRP